MHLCIPILALLALATATPSDICSQTFDVIAGETRTINYYFTDGTYPGNQECTFYLTSGGTEDGLSITFTAIDIEKHAICSFDYLKIFNGPSANFPMLANLCGNILPPPIDTTSNTVTLQFASDKTVHKRGFILHFTTKSKDHYVGSCLPTFTGPSGTLLSPLFPNNYPNKVNCSYEIAPTTGNQILIQFPTFQLERSSYCVMDYVTISSRLRQIGKKLCGNLDNTGFLVPGSSAFINFVSDRSSTRKGFELRYSVVSTCDDLTSVCQNGCKVSDDGSLQCLCHDGFENSYGEVTCSDVNECTSDNGGCKDRCTNTEGSFECSCTRDGFFLAPDGRNCTDQTCATGNGGCEHNCHLSGSGGYFCTCNKGFLISANAHNCTDVDECTSTKYKHSCEQKCNNEPGSYYCDCNAGYSLSPNRRTCIDNDECSTDGAVCEHDCHNYPGGWSCSCFPGYQANPDDPYGCIDIDECSPDLLPPNCVKCTNYDGGFLCHSCKPGFRLNENTTLCLDINECETDNGGCPQDCFNTPGSFNCVCYRGHEQDENECHDINECRPNNGRGPCDHYCENFIGSFECHCRDGYILQSGSGTMCEDINECLLQANGGCEQKCTNNQGSFSCSCFPGYWMIDGACNDIDECVEDKPCDSELGAKCINSIGSFECTCPDGFNVVNTTLCVDIDECTNSTREWNNRCSQLCVNTPGSFKCECRSGFVSLGNDTCTDINECSQSLCEYQYGCVNSIGSFECSCPDGFFLLADGIHCSDVDECSGEVNCDQVCLNEVGSYQCACRDGYILNSDGSTCADINECDRNTSKCSDGCINTRGGYYCFCFQGYEFTPADNFTCADTNECESDNGGCHHICRNTQGSFSCSCLPGYQFSEEDSICVDIDECANNNGGCEQMCNNTVSSYFCSCEADRKMAADNHTCEHCPTCKEFEGVISDLAKLTSLPSAVQHLTQANMQLSATVALLRSELDEVKRQLAEK